MPAAPANPINGFDAQHTDYTPVEPVRSSSTPTAPPRNHVVSHVSNNGTKMMSTMRSTDQPAAKGRTSGRPHVTQNAHRHRIKSPLSFRLSAIIRQSSEPKTRTNLAEQKIVESVVFKPTSPVPATSESPAVSCTDAVEDCGCVQSGGCTERCPVSQTRTRSQPDVDGCRLSDEPTDSERQHGPPVRRSLSQGQCHGFCSGKRASSPGLSTFYRSLSATQEPKTADAGSPLLVGLFSDPPYSSESYLINRATPTRCGFGGNYRRSPHSGPSSTTSRSLTSSSTDVQTSFDDHLPDVGDRRLEMVIDSEKLTTHSMPGTLDRRYASRKSHQSPAADLLGRSVQLYLESQSRTSTDEGDATELSSHLNDARLIDDEKSTPENRLVKELTDEAVHSQSTGDSITPSGPHRPRGTSWRFRSTAGGRSSNHVISRSKSDETLITDSVVDCSKCLPKTIVFVRPLGEIRAHGNNMNAKHRFWRRQSLESGCTSDFKCTLRLLKNSFRSNYKPKKAKQVVSPLAVSNDRYDSIFGAHIKKSESFDSGIDTKNDSTGARTGADDHTESTSLTDSPASASHDPQEQSRKSSGTTEEREIGLPAEADDAASQEGEVNVAGKNDESGLDIPPKKLPLTDAEMDYDALTLLLTSRLPDEDEFLRQALTPSSQYRTPIHYMNGVFDNVIRSIQSDASDSRDISNLEPESDTKGVLLTSIKAKLQALDREKQRLSESAREMQQLAAQVSDVVCGKVAGKHFAKYRSYVDELGKVVRLLLMLACRRAQTDNAINALTVDVGTEEHKKSLTTKRDQLLERFEDALALKEGIDRRRRTLDGVLRDALTRDEMLDFDLSIRATVKLRLDGQWLDDRIQLAQKQLAALMDNILSSSEATNC